jgi:hypothetical protein
MTFFILIYFCYSFVRKQKGNISSPLGVDFLESFSLVQIPALKTQPLFQPSALIFCSTLNPTVMPSNPESHLTAIIGQSKSLDLPLLEHTLDHHLLESWELFNLVKPHLSQKEVSEKRNALYQLELLFLTVSKCNRCEFT